MLSNFYLASLSRVLLNSNIRVCLICDRLTALSIFLQFRVQNGTPAEYMRKLARLQYQCHRQETEDSRVCGNSKNRFFFFSLLAWLAHFLCVILGASRFKVRP